MKILDIEKIREADRFTIENETISSIDLMERAGKNCTKWIRKKLNKEQDIFIFVGPGNNGGDGLVIARLLAEKKYRVTVVMLLFTEHFSDDFTTNLNRLEEQNIAQLVKVRRKEDIPVIDKGSLIIDAIFGSGLNRAVSSIAKPKDVTMIYVGILPKVIDPRFFPSISISYKLYCLDESSS